MKTLKYTDVPAPLQMAVGTVVPQRTPRAAEYLDNVRDFNQTQTWDIYKIIGLCRKLYYFGGQISTAIDILSEFPVTDFNIYNVNSPRCQKLLKYFKEQVNRNNPNAMPGLYRVARQISHDYFLCGNAFPYEVWDVVNDEDYGIKDKNLPAKITILNPSNIKVPKEYVSLGHRRIYLKLEQNLINVLKKRGRRTKAEKDMLTLIPDNIKQQAKRTNWDGTVLIDNDFITHLRRKGQDYDVWGIPYLTKAFSAAATLQRLRLLDDATVEGMINYITVFRIGDPDNPSTWSEARINTFARMLQDPAATNMLVWPYDVDVITTGPDGKILDMSDKFKQVNYEILGALGIPEILFSGQGSQAGVWVAVLAMLERLEKFRDDLQLYIENVLRKVCVQNGYGKEFPKISWARMRLRDDNAVKNIVVTMFDRGLIPYQTFLSEFGYDYAATRAMREAEKKSGDDKVFAVPNMPFSTPGGNENKESNKPKEKKSDPKSDNGRPPDETKKDSGASYELSVSSARDLMHERIDNIAETIETLMSENRFMGDVEIASVTGTEFWKVALDVEHAILTIVRAAKHMVDTITVDTDARDLRLKTKKELKNIRNDLITSAIMLTRKIQLEEIDTEEYFGDLRDLLDNSKLSVDLVIGQLQTFESQVSNVVRNILEVDTDNE